jgi:hypothetical protein
VAVNARLTHCKWGHPFSGANLYIRPDGSMRECVECRRQRVIRCRERQATG